jgi:NhaP-type Na+/H+ or K+/H+ antiporter
VRDTIKVLIILSIAFFIVSLETLLSDILPLSGLLSVMVMGITFLALSRERAHRLRNKFSKIWVLAELVLFVLVGAAVDISLAFQAGSIAIVLIALELTFRMSGVAVSLIKTNLNYKERLFTGIAYIPKATVQAAIGGIPLALGVPNGDLILAIAVLSILITAPLGAIGIDLTKDQLLNKKEPTV